MLGMSLSSCCRFHPAEVRVPSRRTFEECRALVAYAFGAALGTRDECGEGPATMLFLLRREGLHQFPQPVGRGCNSASAKSVQNFCPS